MISSTFDPPEAMAQLLRAEAAVPWHRQPYDSGDPRGRRVRNN